MQRAVLVGEFQNPLMMQIVPMYKHSKVNQMIIYKVLSTVQKRWCVGYYRINIEEHKTVPVPRSRDMYDVSDLYPLSNVFFPTTE